MGSPPGECGSSSRSLGLSHCLSLATIETTCMGSAQQNPASGGVSRLMQIACIFPGSSHCFLVTHAWGSTHCCLPPLSPPALFGQNLLWAQAQRMSHCPAKHRHTSVSPSSSLRPALWCCPEHKDSVSRLLSAVWVFFGTLLNNTQAGGELWPVTLPGGVSAKKSPAVGCRTKLGMQRGRGSWGHRVWSFSIIVQDLQHRNRCY